MAPTPRTDPHRPGAIVPAEYEYVLSYNLATSHDGWPIPSYGVNCALDRRTLDKDGKIIKNGEHDADRRCCVVALLASGATFAEHGDTGRCSVCGVGFVYGDIWRHVPTGEHIHIGHICADKYNLLTDRSAWELAHGRALAAAATQVQKALNREAYDKFCEAHPGLAAALAGDHNILRDLHAKLLQYHSLSEKQVAFAFKLADELAHPKAAEQHVPAPIGNGIAVRGKIVSLKMQETQYGNTLRMTVKVTTPDGVWLVWGTCPSGIAAAAEVGDTVSFTANLTAGNEPHFAFAKRPRLAKIEETAAAKQEVA